MNEVYEKYVKLDDGRFIFVGWGPIIKDFAIEIKETKKFIYVTYEYLTGNIEIYRYRK